MSSPLRFEREEKGPAAGVVTVWLEQPGRPVVALDRALFERLDATLDAIGATAKGFVLASTAERAWVAGADLKEIDALSDDQLQDYLELGARVMGRIAHLHCPTVAAIHGATLGGGLELAMHCDALVACLKPGAKAYPIGLPEAALGICPGWGGTNLLPARIDPAHAILMTAKGATLDITQAREASLVDELVDSPEALMAEARELAATLVKAAPEREPRNIHEPEWRDNVRAALAKISGELPDTKAAKAVKLAVQTGLDLGWDAAIAAERHLLIHLRRTEEGRAGVKAFLAKGAK